jgi:putative ABC transport system permease protein
MAMQNLLRRPTRTFMLILAVSLVTGAIFASFTIASGIEKSMRQSFSRMGADLLVVPEDTMVNITSALLTVQPTDLTLDRKTMDEIAHLNGVAQVAPQTICKISMMAGMPAHKVNLIAFDPLNDFTVLPWLQEHLSRPMQTGDVLIGNRIVGKLNDEIEPSGSVATIYGKLGRSGVGPFDESYFVTYATMDAIAKSDRSSVPLYQPDHYSALLVRLNYGATPEQVRFAIAKLPGTKIVSGANVITSTRQTTTTLIQCTVFFTMILILGSLILLCLLFSAIIAERQREVGLLRAIGARHGDIVTMLIAEAVFATGIGGLCGVIIGSGLLLLFQHSLVYYLETLHVEFSWPAPSEIAVVACECAVASFTVGLVGAFLPSWKAAKEQPYTLIQGERD